MEASARCLSNLVKAFAVKTKCGVCNYRNGLFGVYYERYLSTHTDPLGMGLGGAGGDSKAGDKLRARQQELMARGLPKKTPIDGVKRVVVVASAKGGVGKSTTAVNLALALAANDPTAKVGLLDADVFGPSIPRLMNLHGEPEVGEDKLMVPLVNYGIKCMSMGFLVGEESAVVWRGLMVMSAVDKLLRLVAWGPLDYLLIDMPPGTGDTQLSISQNVPIDGAVMVTTPQEIALSDVRKGIDMFRKVSVPVLGLVHNMSVYVCPHCGERAHVFGPPHHTHRLAEGARVPLLGEVPLHPVITALSDQGRPPLITDPHGPHAHCYREIAERVVSQLEATSPQTTGSGTGS